MTISRVNLVVSLGVLIALTVAGCTPAPPKTTVTKAIRLGWQPPWANQGQVVEVLKNTDVLRKNDVKVEFKAFTYGGPMTEAALAGELDMLFAGEQPAITLISRDSKWRIVARLVNYRSAILVPPSSPLKELADLSGKKVATAFGSTTHRDAARILRDASLEVGTDVTFVNLDQAEHAALIARGGSEKWADIDAIATYDPTIAVTIEQKKARVLHEWISPAVVVASEDLIKNRSNDLMQFLRAYIESYSIYAKDPERFNALYSQDSRLPLSSEIYKQIAACEPNMAASKPSGVDIILDEKRQETMQRNAEIALSLGIIKKPVNMAQYTDVSLAERAMKDVRDRKQ
jgi:sulfonate transport system substrate-binding protein